MTVALLNRPPPLLVTRPVVHNTVVGQELEFDSAKTVTACAVIDQPQSIIHIRDMSNSEFREKARGHNVTAIQGLSPPHTPIRGTP